MSCINQVDVDDGVDGVDGVDGPNISNDIHR